MTQAVCINGSDRPANKGLKADFLPDENAEVGQDPHIVVMSPSDPDVLWQQNHLKKHSAELLSQLF